MASNSGAENLDLVQSHDELQWVVWTAEFCKCFRDEFGNYGTRVVDTDVNVSTPVFRPGSIALTRQSPPLHLQ